MGLGAGLTFLAIGAILTFATDFTVSGIDIQAVGVILMLCGVASMAFTFLYVRPRRTTATAEVVDEPVYIVHPDEEPHVHRDPYGQATLPHVHGEGGHRTDRRL